MNGMCIATTPHQIIIPSQMVRVFSSYSIGKYIKVFKPYVYSPDSMVYAHMARPYAYGQIRLYGYTHAGPDFKSYRFR